MSVTHRRFLILVIMALLTGCSTVPVMRTPIATLLPVRSETPGPFSTLAPAHSGTPTPFRSFTPTLTKTRSILNTLEPISNPSPIIIPTIAPWCEGCVISNDGKWAARTYGIMIPQAVIGPDWHILRIYRADDTTVRKFFCRESVENRPFVYLPESFDLTNQWLFVGLRTDEMWEDFHYKRPLIRRFVKINVQTGQMVPMLGIGSYDAVKFSPDESLFAYTMDQALGILNMKSGQRSLIALKYKATTHITWKPDGTRFIIAASLDADMGKSWDILLVTPGESQPVQVLDSFPDYSKAVDYMDHKSW
jgi:hypothetical protein